MNPTDAPHAPASAHDDHDAVDFTRASAGRPHALWVSAALLTLGVGLAALFALGYIPQKEQEQNLNTAAALVRTGAPRVAVVKPELGPTFTQLELPGELEALRETPIFAHTTGFLKTWNVDIGGVVTAGQELARIDSPDIDTQLLRAVAAKIQAEAALAQSQAQAEQAAASEKQSEAQLANLQASEELAKTTMDRYDGVRGKGVVTDLEISQNEAALKVAKAAVKAGEAAVVAARASTQASRASVKSAEANVGVTKADVERFQALQGFEHVVAPFPGVITTRQAEIGNMVMDGSSATAQPLFQLAEIETLRLFIDVPQSHSTEVKEGQPVNLAVREYPGRIFTGTVARTSGALDRASRTLRTEIRIPNPKRELLRGMYAQATFRVEHTRPIYLLPASALIVNADGTQVALVRDGRVHFQKVALDGDYGAKFAVATGLNAGDIVISTPSERLLEGMEVSTGN